MRYNRGVFEQGRVLEGAFMEQIQGKDCVKINYHCLLNLHKVLTWLLVCPAWWTFGRHRRAWKLVFSLISVLFEKRKLLFRVSKYILWGLLILSEPGGDMWKIIKVIYAKKKKQEDMFLMKICTLLRKFWGKTCDGY